MHPQAEFSYLSYRPYPGGELYDQAIRSGYRPPQNLREWVIMQDLESGFIQIKKLPWIKDPDFIDYLLFAVPHSTRLVRASNPLIKLAMFIVKQFFRSSLYVRTKFRLEGFYIELKLWEGLRKLRDYYNRVKLRAKGKNYEFCA